MLPKKRNFRRFVRQPHEGDGTRLRQVVKFIEESESLKAGIQGKFERLADMAVPLTFGLAGLVWLIPRERLFAIGEAWALYLEPLARDGMLLSPIFDDNPRPAAPGGDHCLQRLRGAPYTRPCVASHFSNRARCAAKLLRPKPMRKYGSPMP